MMRKKSKNGKAIFAAVGCFCLYFLMMLGILNRGAGFTDESDNFIGGMVIASGRSIYRDFASQHMPVMYYICAILKLLGADSVYRFRLSFYVVLALLWTVVALRYGKSVGRLAAMGTGALYIINMFNLYTCCVLAEQLQSVGCVILFWEILLFARERKLDWKNNMMISLAVFLSFGSAFVSAFMIFAAVLVFLFVGIKTCVEEKTGFACGVQRLFSMFYRTAVFVIVPFVVMILVYALKGTLGDFIYGAYTVNREIYPEYMGGYGSSVLMGFLEPIRSYGQTLTLSLRWLVEEVGLTKEYAAILRWNICFGINFLFWICYAFREGLRGQKHIGEALLLAYFTILCASRGVNTFHGLPYLAVTMAMAAWLLQRYFNFVKQRNGWHKPQYVVATAAIACVLFIYGANYFVACRSIMDTIQNLSTKAVEDPEQIIYWIHTLTKENKTVLLTTIEPQLLVEADRIPYKTGISAPWMYRAFEEVELANLKKNAPRVAVYRSDYEIWGNYMRDYAPEVWQFMEENYTQLDEAKFPALYVKNEYLDEARKIYVAN